MTQRGQLTSELNSSLSLIMATPQKAVDKDMTDIRAHRKVKILQTNHFIYIYNSFLPVLLENDLV